MHQDKRAVYHQKYLIQDLLPHERHTISKEIHRNSRQVSAAPPYAASQHLLVLGVI